MIDIQSADNVAINVNGLWVTMSWDDAVKLRKELKRHLNYEADRLSKAGFGHSADALLKE